MLAVVSLSAIGSISAIVLYFIAQKFKVIEDPRIDTVNEMLPGANCGGCGFAGCRSFAEALVKADNFNDMNCPVSSSESFKAIANFLGVTAIEKDPMIAVLRCNGSFQNINTIVNYDGLSSCAYASLIYSGNNGCAYGCLGFGDCAVSCEFNALKIDSTTGLPIVDENKCVACGACVKACPKNLFELRLKGKKNRRIFVCCKSEEKGVSAKKNCNVACIGCFLCKKICPFEAIEIKNNLAYIDFNKCKLCRKCVSVCPTNAINEVNFSFQEAKIVKKETLETTV